MMIRCLAIDDNRFDRKVLRQAADECELNIDLRQVSDIRSAEKLLQREIFDCMIVDFRLPDGDGLSFAKRFLTVAENRFPIIMLTGKGSEQVAREAFQLGILDYLTKENLSPENLERVIMNALAKVQLERARQAIQDELRRSNEALTQFATLLAHDLKAPICQIMAACSALGEAHLRAFDEDGQKLLRWTARAADRAYNLINGMLAYADLGKAIEPCNRVDLRLAIDDAIANMGDRIKNAGVTIEIGDLPIVLGVQLQLTQLFQNLIDNALKYRDRKRGLIIKISAQAASPDTWEVSVEDNGIGIPTENQERIFNMLERLHGKDQYEGSGIGLAASRRIIENHGGRIWCLSTPSVGSTFIFTLTQHAGASMHSFATLSSDSASE